jgi:hypothetical protein
LSVGILGALSGGIDGVAVSGIANVEGGAACGAVGAGVANIVAGPASGFEGAGVLNVVSERMRGFQGAGVANIAGRGMSGFQAAGVVNVTGDVNGVQAATVNVAAGNVHGVQIGVVNVASDADFTLGVVNVVTHGRWNADAWGLPEAGLLFAGVKNGGAHYHYVYALGARVVDSARAWGALGLGAHITPSNSFYVDLDAISHQEIGPGPNGLYQARCVVGYRFLERLSAFIGPTFNVSSWQNKGSPAIAPSFGALLATNSSTEFRAWPGVAVGVEGL